MLSRRLFMGATSATLLLTPTMVRAQITANPFTLGIASGTPRETSIILWTRLAPQPLVFNGPVGGMPEVDVPVRWRLCSDQSLRTVVQQGTALAQPEHAHAVHVKVEGLQPGRDYWYQFSVGDFDSPVGRTRTSSRAADRTTLAVASCQSYTSGHYAAFRDMAEFAPDCVVHVGDYIYEGAQAPLGTTTREVAGVKLTFESVRQHQGPETVTLMDYRNRYALYRSDPHLQAAHAMSPWIVAMDDHEIDNNWAADVPQDPWAQTLLEFKVRKIAAFKAYWEHMPIETPPIISGVEAMLPMHGAYRFGPALVHLLDTRQYRSDQVCAQSFPGAPSCPELADPSRTLLGAAQEAWLAASLARSDAPFNVLASQMWFSPFRYNAGPGAPELNMDQWDGYPRARQRLIDQLANGVANPVVISGDWHCAAAMTFHADPANIRSRRIGHEFAGTSIASHCPWYPAVHGAQTHNPNVAYVKGDQRGYARFIVDRKTWTTQYRTVDNPYDAASPVRTDKELRTRDF